MCLLCVRMPNAPVNEEYLRNANSNNPDGSGFAILRSDLSGIDTFCSMDGEVAISKYVQAIERDPECWSMFHARYSTHGTETVDNVHPFRVGGSKKTVLAHNGILPVGVPKGSKRSDTRIFAESILPNMGITVLDSKQEYAALEKWCAGSKLAIFSVDTRLNNNVYILNEDAGHWADGTWWSNSGYSFCWSRSVGGYSFKYDRVHGTEIVEADDLSSHEKPLYDFNCPMCKNVLDDSAYDDDICKSCNICLECGDDYYVCMCRVPSRSQELIKY